MSASIQHRSPFLWSFGLFSSFLTALSASTNNLTVMLPSLFLTSPKGNAKCFAVAAKSLQSCPTLCDPIDGSPPGSPIPGILQARTLECVAISFSSAWKWKVKSENEVAQSYPTLSDPMDCSPPGSSVHGTFQAKVLEWGAIAFSEPNVLGFVNDSTSI